MCMAGLVIFVPMGTEADISLTIVPTGTGRYPPRLSRLCALQEPLNSNYTTKTAPFPFPFTPPLYYPIP